MIKSYISRLFVFVACVCALDAMETIIQPCQQDEIDIIAWTNSTRCTLGNIPHRYPNNNMAPFKMLITTVLGFDSARIFYCDLTIDDCEQATILLNDKIAQLHGITLDRKLVLKTISHEKCASRDEIIGSPVKVAPQPNPSYQETIEQLLTWRHFCQRALCSCKWGPYCFSNEYLNDRTMLNFLFTKASLETNPEQERALIRAIQARLPHIVDAVQSYDKYDDLEEQLTTEKQMASLTTIQNYCESRLLILSQTDVGVGQDMESLS